jgi:hypothetical protein
MENYFNSYDSFTKKVVYKFTLGDGGVGDYIKFFMYLLNLCVKNNIRMYYLVENNVVDHFIKLKYPQMYIKPEQLVNVEYLNDIDHLNYINEYNYYIVEAWKMHKFHSIIYDSIQEKVSDYFYFTDEIKTNGAKQNVPGNYISLHVRLGDKFLETDKANVLVKDDVRNYDEDTLFDFIEKNSDKNILFFCDNYDYKQKIKKKYDFVYITDYKIGHTSLSSTTVEEALNGITEFYILTNSTEIYTPTESGFSIVASKFNKIPFFFIK